MKRLSSIALVIFGVVAGQLSLAQVKNNYGNTPNELLPFYQFQKPYKLFFDEPQPYLGEGRKKEIPKNLDSVKVGFLGPLEGSVEEAYGQEMLNGAQLALEEANAKGGYHGLPYELIVRSDVGLWGASGNEIVRLYDAGVWGVIGSIDGNNSHVAIRVALKLEMPMINTGSTDPTLTETKIPWVIRCIADDRQNSYILALHIFEDEKIKNVAIFRANDRYGRMGVKEFMDAARRLGYPIQMHLNFTPGAEDVDSQLEKIRNSSATAVLIWGNDKDAARIVNRMRELGMKQKIFGSDRMATDRFLELTGSNAEGIITSYPYNPESKDPKYLAFVKNYKEKYHSEPGVFATHANDGMNILIDAIEKKGLNHALIRDELTSLGSYHGVTGDIIFDPTWNDVGEVWLMEVKNGKFIIKSSSKRVE